MVPHLFLLFLFLLLSAIEEAAAENKTLCSPSDTLTLAGGYRYPPGTTITVKCPQPDYLGETYSTCTTSGTWRPVRPFTACKQYKANRTVAKSPTDLLYAFANKANNLGDTDDEFDDYYDRDANRTTLPPRARWCTWPRVAPLYPIGVNITVQCPYGYIAGGNVNWTATTAGCSVNATWDGSIANCTNTQSTLRCSLPVTPRNGRILSRSPNISGTPRGLLEFPRGAFIRYECSDGYSMKGPARIMCLADGDWSTDPPKCNRRIYN